jgi:hypothetical protein
MFTLHFVLSWFFKDGLVWDLLVLYFLSLFHWATASRSKYSIFSVTRLGEFSPIGQFLIKFSQFFDYFFHFKSCLIIWTRTGVRIHFGWFWVILGDFCTKSSGRPGHFLKDRNLKWPLIGLVNVQPTLCYIYIFLYNRENIDVLVFLKSQIFGQILGKNIFRIITSVPRNYCLASDFKKCARFVITKIWCFFVALWLNF